MFENFIMTFGFADELVQKHKKRFEILHNFFREYNKQVKSYQFGEKNPYGYCGIIDILIQMIKEKNGLKESGTLSDKYPEDKIIQWFFNGLKTEIG